MAKLQHGLRKALDALPLHSNKTSWLVIYHTDSSGSLAFINNIVAVFEYEVNGIGNTSARNWEWIY